MSSAVHLKTYPEPPLDRREILRYAGGGDAAEVHSLMEECLREVSGKLSYRVCWRRFPVRVYPVGLDLGFAVVKSEKLKKNLSGCDEMILFAATVGLELDRLIARYGRVSPAKGLMLQAIGAERIEGLCDIFCAELREAEGCIKPRFSPGYGDLPLTLQRDIFAVLDCPRRIGLSLNDSLLMSPSKSVTAIVGIGGDACVTAAKCEACENKNCTFRSE